MQKNVGGQKWKVFAFNRTTGNPVTGDAANITANLHIDGGAANPVDDVNPTELSGGYYLFDITQAESNGDLLCIIPVSTTADVQVIGVPGSVWTTSVPADLLEIKGATFNTATDSLEAIRNQGDAAWGGGGAADWTTLEKEQIRNRLGLDGTESIPVSNTPNLGDMELSATAVDKILDDIVEGGQTLRQMVRVMFSALAGKVSGGGTADIIFKGVDGTTARITATVDANGNRTAVVVNGN